MSAASRFISPVLFAFTALLCAWLLVRYVNAPNYTDAYYHFNAASRLAGGAGLTDTYLWTYIGAPELLPPDGIFPSHLYWMPLTSIIAALGMFLTDSPGSFAAAQAPLVLCVAGVGLVGYWLGMRLGGTRRHAWSAGMLTVFGGFFARFWGTTDTFAPFALIGSLGLIMIALGVEALYAKPSRSRLWVWFAAGGLAALGYLTRPDGLLLVMCGAALILWAFVRHRIWRVGIISLLVFALAFAITMLPWMIRNASAVGTVLPLGGSLGIWYTSYDDLFRYPPVFDTSALLDAQQLSLLINARIQALFGEQSFLSGNLGTFIAVEGMIIMTPLMLIGLWNRRKDPFLAPFWLYALGLHVAMTFVFPFPGYRGGLFHGAASLIPIWASLGIVGLDEVVNWVSRRRRRWKPQAAKQFFTAALTIYVIVLSLWIASRGYVPPDNDHIPSLYSELASVLPADARVMINDPSALYYYTGLGGVVVPNSSPAVIPTIARQYRIDYVVLEEAGLPALMIPAWDSPPAFLTPIVFSQPGVKVYAIHLETPAF